MRYLLSIFLFTASFSAQAALDVQAPFQVFPTDVNLSSARDRQSLVVRVTEANGVHRDVTGEAKFTIADAAKAKIDMP